jgi:iron complex transport system substrate-binding protein
MTRLRQLFLLILPLLWVVGAELAAETTPAGPVAAAKVRVLSQTVGTDELLLSLADPEQVAALSHLSREAAYSAVAAEAARYPQISPNCDAEEALKHAPTLVLCADYSRSEFVSQVRRAGIRVIVFNKYRTLEDSYENLRIVARELGKQEKAERIIADCQARVAALQRRLVGVRPVRVIVPSIYSLIAGSNTTFQDLADHAAAENLAATIGHIEGHKTPPSEQMLIWPVEKLVLAGNTLEEALEPFRKIPPYQFMRSVREGRAVLIPNYVLSCVTHYRVDGYEALAKALHPELFAPSAAAGAAPTR